MIFKNVAIIGVLAFSLSLSGCYLSKQHVGTTVGGTAGALIGSSIGRGQGRFVSTAIGGLIGSLVGGFVGAELDNKDRQMINFSAHDTLDERIPGNSSKWLNQKTGNRGQSKVSKIFLENGTTCKMIDTLVHDRQGRLIKKGADKFCRGANGYWRNM